MKGRGARRRVSVKKKKQTTATTAGVAPCSAHFALDVQSRDNGLEEPREAPQFDAGAVWKERQGLEQRAKGRRDLFEVPGGRQGVRR